MLPRMRTWPGRANRVGLKKESPHSGLLDTRDLDYWNRLEGTRSASVIAGRSYRADSYVDQKYFCQASASSLETEAVAGVLLLVRLLFEHLLCLFDRHIMRRNEEI